MNTRRLTLMAALSAIALTIFVAEAQIPPIVPVPGVKLGLANIVTLVSMALLGRRDSAMVLAVRVILGSVFGGSMSAFLYSACGGALAWLVMALTIGFFREKLLWIVSVFGAIAHNAGQLTVAVWVTGTPSILYYAPALLAAAIVTGIFTGIAGMYLYRAAGKLKLG